MNNTNNSINKIVIKLCIAFLVIVGYFIFVYKLGILDSIEQVFKTSSPSPDGTYKSVSVDKMFEDLENNALVAEDEYKGQYVSVTGKLGNIDTDYISLYKINDKYSLDDVLCYFKNDEQKNAVKTMHVGDIVTVKGKITKIGEILGYYHLTMTEIPQKK